MLSVVPLKKYCEISGENLKAVQARIEKGIWLEGKQVHKIQNVKERWVDLKEVEKWARRGGKFQAA
jgi:hypothetical protein